MITNDLNVEQLVSYHVRESLIHADMFLQVYEEILTLAYWVKGFRPRNFLEIGFKGPTFHILSHLCTGKRVAIDLRDEGRSTLFHFMNYDFDARMFVGDSQTMQMRESVRAFCNEFDLIVIDGDHTYTGVENDFRLYRELLSDRGYLVFHDVDEQHVFKDSSGGEVYKFWRDLTVGSKTQIVTTKSSGRISCHGHTERFGGFGLWRETS